MNSGRRSGKGLPGGVCGTGQGLPRHLKSLHLEGVRFLMQGAMAAMAGGDIFWTFLQQDSEFSMRSVGDTRGIGGFEHHWPS